MIARYASLTDRMGSGLRSRVRRKRRYLRAPALLTALALLWLVQSATLLAASKASRDSLLDFEGEVKFPHMMISHRARVALMLYSVESPFRRQAIADFGGHFRFHDLAPGTYVLSIYFPNFGRIVETIDITKSFADSKRTVRKKYEYDEKALRTIASSIAENVVSVRELTIPQSARSEYQRAQERLEREDPDGAILHLEKAIDKAPQFAEALNHLGTIYFQKRDFTKAEGFFRKALQQNPQAWEPLVNLGGALLAEGRMREALAINRHAQNARPKDPLANAQLGLSYFALGDYDSAIEYLEATEEADPAHFTHPQISLAEIYLRRSNAPNALRQLEEFLKVHPDSSEAPAVRAAIEKIRKQQEEHPAEDADENEREDPDREENQDVGNESDQDASHQADDGSAPNSQ